MIRMSPEKEQEFDELRRFVDMYATNFMKIDPANSIHPSHVSQRIIATVGRSEALVGVRQAANDCLEGLQDLTLDEVRELDAALRTAGIITLSELRRRQSGKYKGILKRGRIRTETEYYMIKAVLDDCSASTSQDEVQNLDSMISSYELAVNNSFKPRPLRGSA